MGRARRTNILRVGIESLERRDNPSSFGMQPLANAQPSPIMPRTDFHHFYLKTLTIREFVATQAATRVSQAFQLFEQNALGIPVKLNGLGQSGAGTNSQQSVVFRQLDSGPTVPLVNTPAGTVPHPDTYENIFAQLAAYTDGALTTYIERTYRLNPSVRAAPNYSPRAANILVPYANCPDCPGRTTVPGEPSGLQPHHGPVGEPGPQASG